MIWFMGGGKLTMMIVMVITIGTVMVLLMFDDGETPTGRDLKKKVRLLGWRSNQRVPLNNRGWITSLTRGRWQVKRLETELLALAWGGWGRKTIVLNNLSSGWNFSTNFLNHSSSAEKKNLLIDSSTLTKSSGRPSWCWTIQIRWWCFCLLSWKVKARLRRLGESQSAGIKIQNTRERRKRGRHR